MVPSVISISTIAEASLNCVIGGVGCRCWRWACIRGVAAATAAAHVVGFTLFERLISILFTMGQFVGSILYDGSKRCAVVAIVICPICICIGADSLLWFFHWEV
jgi:hypothetical protein